MSSETYTTAIECAEGGDGQAVDVEPLDRETSARCSLLERELLETSRELHGLAREVETLRMSLAAERDDREDLLAIVAHELRTPAMVIGGYLRLMLAGEAGPLQTEQRRFLEECEAACTKLDGFVARTLESARVHGSVTALETRTGPLTSLVDEVLDALAGPLRSHGLEVHNRVDSAHHARCDPHAVERVLLNLVGNAVRYARGEIAVESRALSEQGRPLVEISVHDDGPGVAAEDRARIFMPYVRGDDAAHGGVGLGLAMCRRLVEAHGGTIGVREAASGGSCFWFTLPGREA